MELTHKHHPISNPTLKLTHKKSTYRNPSRHKVALIEEQDEVFVGFVFLHVLFNVLGSCTQRITSVQDLERKIISRGTRL